MFSVSGCCTTSTGTGNATSQRSHLAELERHHLGDGVITHDYYFIGDYLQKHPGSAKHAGDTERFQREAQQTSGMTALKPPFR